jgi:hypothetical protein
MCVRFFSNNDTEITSDFECGNGEKIRQTGDNHFAFETHRDWGKGDPLNMQNWYFCVRVLNRSGRQRSLHFDVRIPSHKSHSEAYVRAKRGNSWEHLPVEVLSAADGSCIDCSRDDWVFRITLPLAADETVYLSNGFWFPPSEMTAWLGVTAERHSDICTLDQIGRTNQGRPISVLTIPDSGNTEKKKHILVAASPQGSEIGAWVCRRLIEVLLGKDPFAVNIRKTLSVDIIPQTNPDGEALGSVMVNSSGQNPLFEFKQIAHGGTGSAEAESLWNRVKNNPPDAYLEYHSYYQENRPSFRPYLFSPDLHHDKSLRAIAEEVSKRLLEISTGPPMIVEKNDERFSNSFPYQLIEKFDTIAHFYKLHQRESLEDNLDQAVRVFRTVAEVAGFA